MSATNLIPREVQVGYIAHPDPLRGEDGVLLELIDDPLVRPLTEGDLIFGWEGDRRLALYVNPAMLRWELWRYENDGVYRMTAEWSMAQTRGADIVPTIIQFLVSHDGRRGFDAHEAMLKRYEEYQKGAERIKKELIQEAAERVAWGIRKDLK